jgi:hypothetical protein
MLTVESQGGPQIIIIPFNTKPRNIITIQSNSSSVPTVPKSQSLRRERQRDRESLTDQTDPMKRNPKRNFTSWNSRGRSESGSEYGQGGGEFSSNFA